MTDPLEKQRYGKVVAVEEKLSRLYLDRFGREIPDPTPIAPPIGYKKQPSMVDHVRAMVAHGLRERAEQMGYETFEEANDFDVGDDVEPETPYEQLGYEGELGPLPAEVATWSPDHRKAFMEGRQRAYEESLAKDNAERSDASSSKSPPAAAGGAEPHPNGVPTPPNSTSQTGPASSPAAPPAGKLGQ